MACSYNPILAFKICGRIPHEGLTTTAAVIKVVAESVPQIIAWILTGLAKTVWVFYLARLVAGIGDAALFATSPIYVCEIAEPKVRGTWGNTVAISIYFGIFLINVIGAYNDVVTTAIISQQFSGLPAFEMHTQYMFKEAGGNISEKSSAMILSGTLALSVGLSAFIVERFGRKPLTIFSCFGCGIILAIETAYFLITQYEIFDTSNFGWLPLVGMLTYIVVCSTGIGILPTLILGEIFSASIKGKATSVMNIGLAICILIVPKLFHSLTYHFGIFSPFCFFAICCFASGIFSCFYVIETKGKTLEEIQQELKGNPKQKRSHNKC
ncbi:hypothetical protein ILUMI_26784 [Ignelater luminosus]|uniref:Major facilitator superfamily (MFS) profile domain-containing protein n=1 Tax=Ignelater luminosus TaxID=2038154 RepID=A0A8K0FYT6_IGNLU|nr:hypothetical protein ILUMI_26784 [Ignelater luminosus]